MSMHPLRLGGVIFILSIYNHKLYPLWHGIAFRSPTLQIGREVAKWMGLKLLMLKCIFWVCRSSSFYMLNWFCMSGRLIVSIWAGLEILCKFAHFIWGAFGGNVLISWNQDVKAYLFGFDTIYSDLYEVYHGKDKTLNFQHLDDC